MLALYDYMQTDQDSSQVEWRVVQELPFYSRANVSDREALVAELLQTARTWGVTSRRVVPQDVLALVCPAGSGRQLRASLPVAFANLKIIETFGSHRPCNS